MGNPFFIVLICIFAFIMEAFAAGPKPFTPEIYQSKDGKESITLVSEEIAERLVNGVTTTGRYVTKKNTLHLTLSAQGVSFTKDYQLTKEGLVSKNGDVLYKKKATFETVAEIEVDRRTRDPETRYPAPVYPSWAREGGVAGKLSLSITVDDKGFLTDVAVLESSGNRALDMYTRNWVLSRWRYPKGKAGTYRMPVIFKLRSEDPQSDSTKSKISGAPPITSSQKNFPAPPYPGHLRELQSDVSITLGMAVNANGEVVSTKILKSSGHEKVDAYTAEWVQKRWKFPQGAPRFLQQPFKYSPGDLKPTDAAAGEKPAAP
jgi:TonB family protein